MRFSMQMLHTIVVTWSTTCEVHMANYTAQPAAYREGYGNRDGAVEGGTQQSETAWYQKLASLCFVCVPFLEKKVDVCLEGGV